MSALKILFIVILIAAALALAFRPSTTSTSAKTSAGWQADQISLTGEWYPSVALSGASDSLRDYLSRVDLSAVPPKQLAIYLDRVLEEEILPQHRTDYEATLDAILTSAQKLCAERGVEVRRASGTSGAIEHGPHVPPKLVVQTRIYENGAVRITITNKLIEPYSWVTYAKEFRGAPHFEDEQSFP